MFLKYCLLSSLIFLMLSCQTYKKNNQGFYNPQSLSKADSKKYKLDPKFYKKTTEVQNILIASSANVSDTAHRETAYLFDLMMQKIKPDIAQRIRDKELLCILVAWNELTSDVPQFASKKTGKELDFYNWRARGFLSKKDNRFVVFFAEEDVLEYEGGAKTESILVHEFGHVVHKAGFDPKLENKLTETFYKSMNAKLWRDGLAAQRFRRVTSRSPVCLLDALKESFPDIPEQLLIKCLDGGDIRVNNQRVNTNVKVTKDDDVRIFFGGPKKCYATKNKAEYFAEGFQIWFDTNRTMDHDHNHIRTREQLKKYDPYLAGFCELVIDDTDWRFTSPSKRAGKKHLFDFDPKKSPIKTDPDHIKLAALDYYDKYWKDYWKRLADKHGVKLKPEVK